MILRLDQQSESTASVPDGLRPFIIETGTGFEIAGDPTGFVNLFLFLSEDWAAVGDDLGELLTLALAEGQDIRLDSFGISALLHNGLVPLPRTVYQDVFHLSLGDTVGISKANGRVRADFRFSYPWTPDQSVGDQVASEETLLALLTAATEGQMARTNNRGVLMLSSGKDSPSVALALAEAGLKDVTTRTYRTGPDDPEPPVAAEIAGRLGLKHEIIDLPTDSGFVERSLVRFFETAPMAGTDLSQIPYVLALADLDAQSGAVVDGGGSDLYMGYPPSGHDVAKLRYRIRGRRLASLVQAVAPVDSPLNYLARSRCEAGLPGRTMRNRHVAALYPDAEDAAGWWYQHSSETRHLDTFDLFAAVLERHHSPTQILMKQRLAADAVGMTSALPWADLALANYYFNLPQEEKYDLSTGKSKLLVRRMLHRYLDYDAEVVGKHYFEFNGPEFIINNMDFVRSQIESSPLWDPNGVRQIHQWLDKIDQRPLLYHALLTVFMVSGWSNHNRFVRHAVRGSLAARPET